MPLPLPNLDDRRWADLVEEGRTLIPRHAAEWTDHNISDPGVTLIELFAWLAEMNIYRLNQVPERHRRKFLALIGFSSRPPRPARTTLTFGPEPGTPAFRLAAGTVFEPTDSARQATQFRTQHDLTVVDASLAAVQVDEGYGPRDRWRAYHSGLPFAPFGPDPQPGAALYLGFDAPLPAIGDLAPDSPRLSIGLRFLGEKSGPEERARLIQEARARVEACRRPLPPIRCDDEGVEDEPHTEPGLAPHHSVRTVWEFFAADGGGRWVTLQPEAGEVTDDTRSMTLDGMVRLALPSAMRATQLGDIGRDLYYLRCRLERGQYDAAPRLAGVSLNAVAAEQAVSAWGRFNIAPAATVTGPAPAPGDTTRLAFDLDSEGVVTALDFRPGAAGWPELRVLEYEAPDAISNIPGVLSLDLVWLGRGTGAPNQEVSLPEAPVVADSVALYTLERTSAGVAWRAWTRQQDLDASERADAHYTLDPTTGQVRFGDGERGFVPPGRWSLVPESDVLLLASYHTTRAEGGNLPAGTAMRPAELPSNELLLAQLPLNVRDQLARITANPAPASGGAPAETLAHAIGRAVETLWAHERLQTTCEEYNCQTLDQIPADAVRSLPSPSRAVNTLDIERLALAVPGTQVRRARAWTSLHPDYPCVKAVGVVTLMILPELPLGRPEPSPGLLAAVRRYLERRRMVTTRIEVAAPGYREVRIQAQIQRCHGIDPDRLAADVRAALDRFLDPLRGGPEGHGWPFGRDVYRAEVLQVIDGVAGVEYVRELALVADDDRPQCGNLCLGPTWLVRPGPHEIEVT